MIQAAQQFTTVVESLQFAPARLSHALPVNRDDLQSIRASQPEVRL